jgi:hypothetical protein
MNDLNSVNVWSVVIGVTGLVAGVSGVILNYLNKDRYQTQVDVYKPENEELRAINSRKTADIGELSKQNDVLRAEAKQKDIQIKDLKDLNSKQPDFEKLIGVMSDNHREVLTRLTDITKKAMR